MPPQQTGIDNPLDAAIVAAGEAHVREVGSDESGAAGDENAHRGLVLEGCGLPPMDECAGLRVTARGAGTGRPIAVTEGRSR